MIITLRLSFTAKMNDFYNRLFDYVSHKVPKGKQLGFDIRTCILPGQTLATEFNHLEHGDKRDVEMWKFLIFLRHRYNVVGVGSDGNWWAREDDYAYFRIKREKLIMVHRFILFEDDDRYVDHSVKISREFARVLAEGLMNAGRWFFIYGFQGAIQPMDRPYSFPYQEKDIPVSEISSYVRENHRVFGFVLNELLLKPPTIDKGGTFPGGTDYFKVQKKVKEF